MRLSGHRILGSRRGRDHVPLRDGALVREVKLAQLRSIRLTPIRCLAENLSRLVYALMSVVQIPQILMVGMTGRGRMGGKIWLDHLG